MFEKFTEGAIRIIMGAQEEARRMGHGYVGTEQLILGIIGQRRGIAGLVLYEQGIRLKAFRREVEKHVGRGKGFVGGDIPFTPRAKLVLEIAINEGRDMGVNYVGSEHLLLAILIEGKGLAFKILNSFKINLKETQRLIYEYMGDLDEYVAWEQKDLKLKEERFRRFQKRMFLVYKERVTDEASPMFRAKQADKDYNEYQKSEYSNSTFSYNSMKRKRFKDPLRGNSKSWKNSTDAESDMDFEAITPRPFPYPEEMGPMKKKEKKI